MHAWLVPRARSVQRAEASAARRSPMPRRAPATATPHTAAAHLEGSVGKYQPKRTYFFHFLDRSHPKRHKTCPDFLEIGSPSICVPMPVRAMASRTRAGVMPASHKKGTLQTVLQTYQPKRTELSRIKILARCDIATTTETYKRQTTDFWWCRALVAHQTRVRGTLFAAHRSKGAN